MTDAPVERLAKVLESAGTFRDPFALAMNLHALGIGLVAEAREAGIREALPEEADDYLIEAIGHVGSRTITENKIRTRLAAQRRRLGVE